MTYTDAARINQEIKPQNFLFKDSKKIADGEDEQWGLLEDGRYVYNKGCRTSDMMVLIGVPTQSLKHQVRLVLEHIPANEWIMARRRFLDAT